jgi:catechol 2,3-dioxygenase-like lactoylglutathione lyase family enzyme
MLAELARPRLHHVGIVVPSEHQAQTLIELLGFREQGRGFVERYRALCIFTAGNGASPLELVVPREGRLREFNRGLGGLHHIAVQVASFASLQTRLGEQGISLLEPEPVQGAGSFVCNFLDPVYTRGVIVEFVQELPSALVP